jgi:hypothetical protein
VPLSARLVKRFTLSGQPDWMAADKRYLFVREDSGEVVAVNPRSNKVAWRVSVPSENLCQGLGLGFGSLWTCATSPTSDTDDVVRIDLHTHRLVATLAVGKSAREGRLATGFGRVWVINSLRRGAASSASTRKRTRPTRRSLSASWRATSPSTTTSSGPWGR